MLRLLFAAFLSLAALDLAVGADIVLVQTSPGAFVLEGRSFKGVAAADVTLNFDPARLKDVRVVQGDFAAGGLFVANPLPEGRVRIALVQTRPLDGSGILAHLTGKPAGSAGDSFSSVSASLKGEKGNPLPVRTAWVPSTPPSTPPPGENTEPPLSGDLPPSTGSQEGIVPAPEKVGNRKSGGSRVLLPSPGEMRAAAPPVPTTAIDFPQAGAAVEAGSTPGMASPSKRDLPPAPGRPKGEWMSRDLLALFQNPEGTPSLDEKLRLLREPLGEGVRQDPMPAVSDGKESLRILLGGLSQQDPPDAAASNARIIGVRRSEGGGWEIEVVPESWAQEATLLVMGKESIGTISLVVAPPVSVDLDGKPGITAGDLDAFRRKSSGFDLNGDGRRDAVDDYIFLVNYLKGGGATDSGPNP